MSNTETVGLPEDAQEPWLDQLNNRVSASKVGGLFELKARKSSFTKELCASITVFLTVAQIIALNPAILSASGGPCSISDCTGPFKGTAKCRIPEVDAGYAACVAATSQSLVATTCISAALGCFMMALLANMPLILAPGMGVNAFFLAMVGEYGSGTLTYQQGMAVVLVTALLILAASLIGLRGRLMQLFPSHLVFAMVVGLGLFLALTGLTASTGIGLVVAHPDTLVSAGGCTQAHQARAIVLPPGTGIDNIPTDNLVLSNAYGCKGGTLHSASTWLGMAATLLIVLLMASKVSAAVAYGVLFATAIAWCPGHSASYFSGPPGSPAAVRLENFKKVVSLPNPTKTSLQFDFTAFTHSEAWAGLFGMFYLVFLDSTGCAFALAGAMDQHIPGFVRQPGFEFPRRMAALVSDGLACIPGALMGTSPLIVMAESSVAVEQGGHTGLTSLLAGCMFLLAMFFAPLFSNIPPYATGPALIVVGCLMVSTARFINWENIKEAFPAFVTIVIMPFTYSISNGLLAGIVATFALWVLDIGSALLQAVLSRGSPDAKPPREVLSDHFATWRMAFGDMTWAGYKSEAMETFRRARSMRLSRAATLSAALRRMGSSFTGRYERSASSAALEGDEENGHARPGNGLPTIDENGKGP